jgi:hypothetical protein
LLVGPDPPFSLAFGRNYSQVVPAFDPLKEPQYCRFDAAYTRRLSVGVRGYRGVCVPTEELLALLA